MMKIINLGSGSKGNCTLIFNKFKECIVIDCGIAKKHLSKLLEKLNYDLDDILAVLYTHNHSDHFSQHKIFHSNKTYQPFKLAPDQTEEVHMIENSAVIEIGHFQIRSFYVNHDALPTINFIVECDDEKLTLITDTGFVQEEVFPLIKNSDYYLFESNYDEAMLLDSQREYTLKRRILSDIGHLSNTQCAVYLSKLIGDKTKQIMLIHLSEECNTKDLASATYYKVMKEIFDEVPNIKMKLANQRRVTTLGEDLDYLQNQNNLEDEQY